MQVPIDMDMKVFVAGPTTRNIPRGVTLKLHDAFFLYEAGHAIVHGFIESDEGNWVEQVIELRSTHDTR